MCREGYRVHTAAFAHALPRSADVFCILGPGAHDAFQQPNCLLRPQVLEGYIYLGGTARLGEEVMHAYASAVDTAVLKTLRSILLTRPGLEGRVKGAGILQELIKLLPADLFRVCLARVRSTP